jgi:hypothetical protein
MGDSKWPNWTVKPQNSDYEECHMGDNIEQMDFCPKAAY